jgi:cytidylate kinase
MADEKKFIIAIDGYSSCGKSSFAKAIATRLNYTYIDTGAMYRAVTLVAHANHAIRNGEINQSLLKELLKDLNITFNRNVTTGSNETYINGEKVEDQIRSMEISNYVSIVSQIKFVREKMVEMQREMSKSKSVVIDGRDIGTVVFPNADIKIFMTADTDVRTKRRFDELIAKGENVSFEEIKNNLIKRDEQDTTRALSPLVKADDALVLDNSNMTPNDQMLWFNKILESKQTSGKN